MGHCVCLHCRNYLFNLLLLCICSGEGIFIGVLVKISSLKGETVKVRYWPTYNGKIRQEYNSYSKKGTPPTVAWIPFRSASAKGRLSAGTYIFISIGFTVKAVAKCVPRIRLPGQP